MNLLSTVTARALGRVVPASLRLGAAGFCASISWQIVVPVLPLRLVHVGYTPSHIGVLIGVYSLTMAVVELQAGAVAALLGVRWTLLGGYTANALCLATAAGGRARAVVAGALPAIGAARGLMMPPLHATVANSTGAETRGRAFGVFWLCTAFAALAGPALGGFAAGRYGDAAPFGLAALFSLAALPILAVTAASGRRAAEAGPSFGDLAAFVSEPAVARLGASIFVCYSVAGVWTTFLPLYAAAQGISVVAIGWMFAVQGCAYALMQLPTGRLITPERGRWLAVSGIAGISGAALCVPLAHSAQVLVAAAAVYGAAVGLLPVTFATLLTWRVPAVRYTTAMSVYNSAIDFGLFAGPLLGAAAARVTVSAPFVLALPLGLVAAGLSVQTRAPAPAAAAASQ